MAYVTGKSGSFVINGTKNLDFKVYWTETYQLTTNTSVVTLKPYCIIQQSGGGARYYLDGTISCNGVRLVNMESTLPTHYFDGAYHTERQIKVASSNAQFVMTSGAIAHNADGSKSVTISANFYGYTVDGSGINAFHVSGSHTITLTNIPRKATITSAPNFTDESNPTISYSNLAGTAVDSLEACISLTGAYEDIKYRAINKTGTSYTFNLTESERNVLRSATTTSNTRSVRFYIRTTIAGTEYLTWVTKTLTIVNANPVISPTVIDTNSATIALTGDNSKLVRYHSNANITMGVSTKKAATIASKSVSNSGIKLTTDGTINGVTSGNFDFIAIDSRGNTTKKTVKNTIVEYVKLTCNIANKKPDAEGNFTFEVTGNYFNGSFGNTNNILDVYYRYKVYGEADGEWLSMTTTLNGNTYRASASLMGLDYQSTYIFEAYAVDKLASTPVSSKNIKSTPVFDWGPNDFNINGTLGFDSVGAVLRRNVDNGNIVLSAVDAEDGIFFRPNGTGDNTAQMIVYKDGLVTIPGTLQLTNTTDASGISYTQPAFIIGPSSGQHLELDNNEIICKTDEGTLTKIYINDGGGGASIGGAGGISTSGPISAASGSTTGAFTVGGKMTANSAAVTGALTVGGNLTVTGKVTASNLKMDQLVAAGSSVTSASWESGVYDFFVGYFQINSNTSWSPVIFRESTSFTIVVADESAFNRWAVTNTGISRSSGSGYLKWLHGYSIV